MAFPYMTALLTLSWLLLLLLLLLLLDRQIIQTQTNRPKICYGKNVQPNADIHKHTPVCMSHVAQLGFKHFCDKSK